VYNTAKMAANKIHDFKIEKKTLEHNAKLKQLLTAMKAHDIDGANIYQMRSMRRVVFACQIHIRGLPMQSAAFSRLRFQRDAYT
jgi:hypothetical protein